MRLIVASTTSALALGVLSLTMGIPPESVGNLIILVVPIGVAFEFERLKRENRR